VWLLADFKCWPSPTRRDNTTAQTLFTAAQCHCLFASFVALPPWDDLNTCRGSEALTGLWLVHADSSASGPQRSPKLILSYSIDLDLPPTPVDLSKCLQSHMFSCCRCFPMASGDQRRRPACPKRLWNTSYWGMGALLSPPTAQNTSPPISAL